MRIIWTFFLFSYSFCTGQTSLKAAPDSFVRYNSADYSLLYPASWKIDTSKNMGIDLFVLSPLENTMDKFRENVNVLSSGTQGEVVTLDTFVKVSLKEIEAMATDYKLIESKVYHVGSLTYHKLDFTAKQGTFNLHMVQYYFVTAVKVYTITLTTEAEKYGQYKKTGLQMLDSFVLKN